AQGSEEGAQGSEEGAQGSVAFVIVSHSEKLAEGVVELAAQMARDVQLRAAGGTDDDRIGTSFDKVSAAIAELRAAGHDVAVLTDLGSANMTVEAVLDFLDEDDAAHVRFCDGPLVEGAVSAAVTAQVGGDLDAVQAAARARELFA
ncbi:MAG TPA: dihydroxyacetone kinase phosphoryl donor subunit DhaM, partial [Propionicimonas sp.]|nr:dihydroxyacetone kinase phosphoryl donor subunit DhaM [Propionicimonas sp.]